MTLLPQPGLMHLLLKKTVAVSDFSHGGRVGKYGRGLKRRKGAICIVVYIIPN